MNFKVTFHLDGTGIYYDPNEPIHLDALLVWALAPMQFHNRCLSRSDKPDDISIPLMRSKINGYNIWHASALFPGDKGIETLRFWRKKLRQDRLHLTNGNPNIKSGVYREYNIPVPLLLVKNMVAYASGSRKKVKKILKRHIKSLGKKRAYGYGRILNIECEEIPHDWSITADGITMRWIPCKNGVRQVRPSPPYWNNFGRVSCCEVGSII
jgi:CRISPR type IV-associated protein Csf3